MHEDRKTETYWNHKLGPNHFASYKGKTITVKAYNKQTKTCYINAGGIMRLQGHGGSYPAATMNERGNTSVKDWCMAVGFKGNANGWTTNGNGGDTPKGETDWPNSSYNHSEPEVSVWVGNLTSDKCNTGGRG